MRKQELKIKGFTLVELIVVIAIIGVLAGILVPSMLGYVKKAKFSGMNSSAKTLYNAGMTACREQDVVKPIPEGVYTYDGCSEANGSTVRVDPVLNRYVYDYFKDAGTTHWAILIEDDCAVGACIQKVEGDAYMGTYPHANNELSDGKTLVQGVNFGKDGTW